MSGMVREKRDREEKKKKRARSIDLSLYKKTSIWEINLEGTQIALKRNLPVKIGNIRTMGPSTINPRPRVYTCNVSLKPVSMRSTGQYRRLSHRPRRTT